MIGTTNSSKFDSWTTTVKHRRTWGTLSMSYVLANLVPNVYELDDFQIRTPTDILGQHIHLVKFDVTSSDGSGNGFNYEDGTFSPDEVIERIQAMLNRALARGAGS